MKRENIENKYSRLRIINLPNIDNEFVIHETTGHSTACFNFTVLNFYK